MHGNTHTHTHKNPSGKNRVKKRAIGLKEKESCCIFFYYVSGWSTHPEGRQHAHINTDMRGKLIKSNVKGICVGTAQCSKHPTHTHTHTSNSSNWRCQQQICTHLSQLLQRTQTFSLGWALWHASKCLNTACCCVCICVCEALKMLGKTAWNHLIGPLIQE